MYKISPESNTSLAVTTSGTTNNSTVSLQPYTGTAQQQWNMLTWGTGATVALASVGTPAVATGGPTPLVPGSAGQWITTSKTPSVGSSVTTYMNGGSPGQNWELIQVPSTPAASPVFAPAAGSYVLKQSVTVTSTTAGATIYYTLDGSTPTTGSASVASGGTVAISKSETLNAIAVASGYSSSVVTTGSYTIAGQLSAGGYHNIQLKSDGTVWGWGANGSGQVGINSSSASITTPTQVTLLTKPVTSIGTGQNTSFAVENDGSLWDWGYNSYNQLGDNTNISRKAPVEIFSSGVSSAAGMGYASACVMTDGTMYAWGGNGDGELGTGNTTGSATPVPVLKAANTPLTGIASIAAGGYHMLAIQKTGSGAYNYALWAWGRNSNGQLGVGNYTDQDFAVAVSGFGGGTAATTPVAIAGGAYHSLVITADGKVWAAGSNGDGQLGNASVTNETSTFVQVGSFNGTAPWVGVDVASNPNALQSVILRNDGTVWATGYNADGELGNNSTGNSSAPVQSIGITTAVQVAAGANHSAALLNSGGSGTVSTWGLNTSGQLGNGTNTGAQATPSTITGFIVAVLQDWKRTHPWAAWVLPV